MHIFKELNYDALNALLCWLFKFSNWLIKYRYNIVLHHYIFYRMSVCLYHDHFLMRDAMAIILEGEKSRFPRHTEGGAFFFWRNSPSAFECVTFFPPRVWCAARHKTGSHPITNEVLELWRAFVYINTNLSLKFIIKHLASDKSLILSIIITSHNFFWSVAEPSERGALHRARHYIFSFSTWNLFFNRFSDGYLRWFVNVKSVFVCV